MGTKKVYTLAYADDVAIMTEEVEGMRGLIREICRGEGVGDKYKQNKNEMQEGERKKENDKINVKGTSNRRCKRNDIFRICDSAEWKTRRTERKRERYYWDRYGG